MKRSAAKIVSKLQNFEQQQRRMDIAQEMLTMFSDDPDMLKKLATGDKPCVYEKTRQVRSNVKALLTVFFIAMGRW